MTWLHRLLCAIGAHRWAYAPPAYFRTYRPIVCQRCGYRSYAEVNDND